VVDKNNPHNVTAAQAGADPAGSAAAALAEAKQYIDEKPSIMYVNAIINEDFESVTIDKSYNEILEAINKNVSIYVSLPLTSEDTVLLPLMTINNGSLNFGI
jgi:hypothetical protein